MSTDFAAPPVPPPVTPKKSRKWMWITGAVVGAVALIAVGSASGKASVQPAAAPAPVTVTAAAPPAVRITVTPAPVTAPPVTVTAPAPPAVTVTAPPAATTAPVAAGPATEITRSGVYVVGVDIQAGKWKSDGKIDRSRGSGYFAVLADPAGSTSDVNNILTNDNPEGQAFATLVDGQGFENNNLHWTLVG